MKNIKFRFQHPSKNWEIVDLEALADDRECMYSDPKMYRGQYTGLKDCNDREIYEGDIIEVNTFRKKNAIMEVKFGYCDNGSNNWKSENLIYGFYVREETAYRNFILGNCRIVGNIYENPELKRKAGGVL